MRNQVSRLQQTARAAWNKSDLGESLERACAELQSILAGYEQGPGGLRLSEAERLRLESAYQLAQGVLSNLVE